MGLAPARSISRGFWIRWRLPPRAASLWWLFQCREGRVDLGKYAVGSALARAGVLGGFDLTPEAAYTKLSHLLALGLAPELVRARMQTCLRGECSI